MVGLADLCGLSFVTITLTAVLVGAKGKDIRPAAQLLQFSFAHPQIHRFSSVTLRLQVLVAVSTRILSAQYGRRRANAKPTLPG